MSAPSTFQQDPLKNPNRWTDIDPLRRIIRSFVFASRGVLDMLRSQTNAWVHAAFTILVVGAGFVLKLSLIEWSLVVLAMGLVWGFEGMNTALERLADALHPDPHPLVGKAKDAASGAVLLSALAAAIVGLVIFLPKLSGLFAWAVDRFS